MIFSRQSSYFVLRIDFCLCLSCFSAYSKVLQITEEYRSHVMTAQAFALLNSGNVSAAVELLMTAYVISAFIKFIISLAASEILS